MEKLFNYTIDGGGLNHTLAARYAERIYILLQRGKFNAAKVAIDEAAKVYDNGGKALIEASIYKSDLSDRVIEILEGYKLQTWYDFDDDLLWAKLRSDPNITYSNFRKIRTQFLKFKRLHDID